MVQFALLPEQAGVPDAVAKAVRLMLGGAVLALVNAAVLIAVDGDTTPGRAGMSIGGGVVGAGVWWLMAWGCQSGRNWARVVVSVIVGLDTVSMLRFVSGAVGIESALLVVLLLIWFVGFVAVMLLWSRGARGYFSS